MWGRRRGGGRRSWRGPRAYTPRDCAKELIATYSRSCTVQAYFPSDRAMLHRRELDYCPPAPHPPPTRLGFVELLIKLRRNPLECWGADFFEEPIAKLRLPFADAFLVHDPQAIKRVLMDNSKNYRK